MVIEINSFPFDDDEYIQDVLDLRTKIFVKDLGVSKFKEFDGLDKEAVHYVVKYDGKVVGTARWRETEFGIIIERFVIDSEFRGKYLGVLLIRFILDELIVSSKRIYLHSTESAVKFFQHNDFVIDGDSFMEVDIKHYRMIHTISE